MTLLLFDDHYAPITSELGFLECEAQLAQEAYVDWMRPIYSKLNTRIENREIRGDFFSKITSLLPLTSIQRHRTLFLPTNSRWTAYLDNGWQGTDVYSAVSYLCKTIGCQGVRAASIPNTFGKSAKSMSGRYGATIFELYALSSEGCSFLNTKRSISTVNDGGRWKFDAIGEQQEFEEPEQYNARQVRDRFSPEILGRYLARLGIQFFSSEFYESPQPALLVSKVGPCPAGLKEYSLDEARASY